MDPNTEMAAARKIATRLDAAIAEVRGEPAGVARTYAQAVRRETGEIEIVALCDADTHEEVFTLILAEDACVYFEAGNPVRVSTRVHLENIALKLHIG